MSDYLRLESLPNEIFHEIFEYLSLSDLNKSFKNLNHRINNILQSLNNRSLRLWSTDSTDEIEMNNFFSSSIVSLIINDEYNVNLNQYPNIHSLTYIYATNNQLEHFLQSKSYHSSVKYLNLTSDDLSLIIQYMFSNEFLSLEQCILRNIDSLLTCPWRITPTMTSITICNDKNLIAFILKSCPNLKRLCLFIFEYSNSSSLFPCVYHSSLKHLSIEMSQPAWTVEMIENLFSSIEVPSLKSFRIRSYEPSLVSFDFIRLVDILNQKLPNLKRFEFDIRLLQNVEIPDFKTIRDLHPFFFNYLTYEYQTGAVLRISTIQRN